MFLRGMVTEIDLAMKLNLKSSKVAIDALLEFLVFSGKILIREEHELPVSFEY